MAARRTERLLNLVICLLHTRSFLTADRIREIVAGYDEATTDEAFKRMFERDKEDLRDLGIPLETGTNPYDDEAGYRVPRGEYALPEITLEADEAAAIGLAARMWSSASLGASATRALRKLEAAGVELTALPEGLQPRLDGGGSGFPALADAVRAGQRVRFDYQRVADPAPARRTVEPWGVVWWHGRWYLAGHDVDRDAPRVFRLSRLRSEPRPFGPQGAVRVPDGLDLIALVSAYDRPSSATSPARLRVRHGRAVGLRRQALDVTEDGPQWDVVTVGYSDPERLVDQVLEYGDDVVVLSPTESRDLILARLHQLADSVASKG